MASRPSSSSTPQYRGNLNKLKYGNEGARQKARAKLPQMTMETISSFLKEIERILQPSGHLLLWADAFGLLSGSIPALVPAGLRAVDLATWRKPRLGMGYRLRRKAEYGLIYQKPPIRAKGIWLDRGMPDSFDDKPSDHAHGKPIEWQRRLILSVTKPGDIVVDPAAGCYSVLEACRGTGRDFIGCDLLLDPNKGA